MPGLPDAASRTVTVHLLRHAHAGDALTWAGPDELRPLSKRGRRQAERLAAFLDAHHLRPGAIVSSPLVRARQTARIVGEVLGLSVTLDERLGGGFDLEELERIVGDAGAAGPMLVGHDPDLSVVLSALCAADGLEMRKGTLATIECERPFRQGSGTLRWLLPPELFADD